LVIVTSDRLTEAEVDLVAEAHKSKLPVIIVRNKADCALKSLSRRLKGYEMDNLKNLLRNDINQAIISQLNGIISRADIFILSAWKFEKDDHMDEKRFLEKLIEIASTREMEEELSTNLQTMFSKKIVHENGKGWLLSQLGEENCIIRSITVYDQSIPHKTRFELSKVVQELSVSVNDFSGTLNRVCRNPKVASKSFYEEISIGKNELEGDIHELLKHYPGFLVDIIKGDYSEMAHSNIKNYQEETITKCFQMGEAEGYYQVGITHTKVQVDLTNRRVLFVTWSEGKKSLSFRHINLLIAP